MTPTPRLVDANTARPSIAGSLAHRDMDGRLDEVFESDLDESTHSVKRSVRAGVEHRYDPSRFY